MTVETAAAAPAIVVHEVGKRFELGSSTRRSALRRIANRLSAPVEADYFWALRHVSFEVPKGAIVGVIGRNGSGKTTLMKMMARITLPSEGTITIAGRVGAMLRMGTGFHPELSGRDNISLSGTILGLSKEKIRELEPQVVDFAALGHFIDAPIKQYSSGMQVRLSFGVSSYMPGEVMIIDEALSVGDGEFQRKCRDRIESVVGQGRTVLLVSHSMPTIREMCREAVVLDKGQVRFVGPAEEAATFYEKEILRGASRRSLE